MLIDEGGDCLQLVDHERAFFGRDGASFTGGAQFGDHLLIVARVQRILRLHGGELEIEVASFRQIVLLHAGVGQEFQNFAVVGGVSGFSQEGENRFKGGAVFPDVPNNGVEIVEHLAGFCREQGIRVLLVDFERFGVRFRSHERIGILSDGLGIVMNGKEFASKQPGFRHLAVLQVSLHQVLQAFGMLIDVGDLFQ